MVGNEENKKKVDIADLTTKNSFDEVENPPAKMKYILLLETQRSPTKRVLLYKLLSARVDTAAIPPLLTDYPKPFHLSSNIQHFLRYDRFGFLFTTPR